MFEAQLAPVTSALEECFGKVLDLFSGINVNEHRNELLCFGGIDGYTLSEAVSDGGGAFSRTVEVKYLIELLGRKNMSAKELCDIFDGEAVPALENCGAAVKEIKRCSCRYSKEQGGYIVSAELRFTSKFETSGAVQSVAFSVGGVSYGCMRSFTIENAAKTGETPLINGVIKSRLVGTRPMKIKVVGETAFGGGAVYNSLKIGLGGVAPSLMIGGMSFSGMAMTGLTLTGEADGSSKITVEFTEVNA